MATVVMHVYSILLMLYVNISVTSTRIIRLDTFYKHNVVLNNITSLILYIFYLFIYLPGKCIFQFTVPNV